MNRYTEEEKIFIENNAVGRTTQELTDLFNQRFNKNVKPVSLRNFKKSHGIKSGINTRFKKGQKAHNYLQIGSEFVSSDGYTFIKTEEPNTWELKHRYLYKKYKGAIPDDCSVIFGNQNKNDFDLDNLILVKIKDKLVAKNKHLLFDNAELTGSGIMVVKLINKIVEINRGEDNEK